MYKERIPNVTPKAIKLKYSKILSTCEDNNDLLLSNYFAQVFKKSLKIPMG